jgi:DNA mismatch endonuclease, patch repair protein
MTDIHSKDVRSYNMSKVKSKDTKPEMLVRKFLFSKGFRYKLHDRKLAGKPDIVLSKYKTVIFVNGCFWHGHQICKYSRLPKTRTEWWQIKIARNVANDDHNIIHLRSLNWKVLIIWSCELRHTLRTETLSRLLEELKK